VVISPPVGLREYCLKDVPEFPSGFGTEFVTHESPDGLVNGQGVVGPAGNVQGDHQTGMHELVHRMLGRQPPKFPDRLVMTAKPELQVDALYIGG
jgi:hypothetical protein